MENESVKVKFGMFAIDAQTSDMLNEKTNKVENIVCSKGFKVIVSLQRRVMSNTEDGKRPDEDVGFIKEYNDQLFIGRKYISMFLKSALWDFGDGTTATGPVAEHCYTEQGTFTIKCTLFKPNREAVENTYKVVVVVKDPMPSMIQFVKDCTTSEVSCSKITRVARLEVFQTASPIITRDLNVIPKRVSDCVNGERRDVTETEYSDKMTNIIGERYFAFYKNEHENKTKDIQTSFKFTPTAVYEPQYQEIYARYFIQDGKPDVRLYSENLELSDRYRHLTVPTITNDGQPFKKDIIVMKDKQSFPEECVLIGKRAFIDVFYKSDTPNIGNRLQFLFDIEEHQSFKGLEHTVNYVNMSPLGIDINIHNNARDKINVGWNLNGIFHEITENGNDVYVEHSFLKGLIETAYASPYIWYTPSDFGIVGEAEREFTIEPFYYVPKDFDVMNMKITTLVGNDTTFEVLLSQSTEWCYKVVFYTNNTVNLSCSFNGKQGILKADKNDEGDVISQEEIITPHEIYFQENTDKVVDVLTTPFGIRDSSNLKDAFKCIFNNDNWLEKTLTKITHFFNNTVHGDTCHVSYLVSLLQSMGEELGEYSESSFQLLNDLNDFTRLLSMQRTNLIGHETSATLDTVFDGEHKGKNVNDEIYPDDIIFTDENGLIIGYQREGKPYKLEVPTEIIIYDRFTKTSRSANFFGFPSPTEWDEDDFDREFLEYKEVYKKNRDDLVFTILDYHKNWGWNLLLPDRFWTHTDAAKNTIGAYYRFFILDPNTEKRRFGNYVDISSFGTEGGGILNENWDADWKMAFHILQKILHSKNRAYADATLYEDAEDDNP